MTESLVKKHCVACEGGEPKATDAEIARLLPDVSGWQVVEIKVEGESIKSLQKRIIFRNFREAMAFLRQVEELAEAEGHHPDFCVHYRQVDFTLYTHAIKGLHENDFILAAKTNELVKSTGF